jgi:hypothetical protein
MEGSRGMGEKAAVLFTRETWSLSNNEAVNGYASDLPMFRDVWDGASGTQPRDV